MGFGLAAALRSLASSPEGGGGGATGGAGDADGAGGSDTHEGLGRCAVALFNLSLTMLGGAHDAAHLAWLPGALRCAEAAVADAHPPRRAPPPPDAAAWRIPTSPPDWATPVLLHPMASTREQPTCASFFSAHLQPGVPLLMHGHLEAEAWGGLAYFADLRALREEHGARLTLTLALALTPTLALTLTLREHGARRDPDPDPEPDPQP